ncbi:hypothetical protein EVAR_41929_1 [Eumeta japonica]|uniref:Uncharacterized protein n=1 Tax=Eumeta variegata TaxID=151549 RepID=A0A4C1XHB4_EUMVA|nr:hypothetical protein EVAR_41929_1 [Eumeta japonica]
MLCRTASASAAIQRRVAERVTNSNSAPCLGYAMRLSYAIDSRWLQAALRNWQRRTGLGGGRRGITHRRSGNSSGANQKVIVLPGLAILAPPRVYALCLGTGGTALCLGTGGTALFTALLIGDERRFLFGLVVMQ